MPGASKEPVPIEVERAEVIEPVHDKPDLKKDQVTNIKSSSGSAAEAQEAKRSKDPLDTLPALRFEADVHFSMSRPDDCLELLNRVRAAEVENHGEESQQVLDTDLAICSALRAATIPEAIRLDKQLEEFIMSEEKELTGLISKVRQRCTSYKKEGGYSPGPNCAKMLVADWFTKFETSKSSAEKKTMLKLYEDAYVERLAKFGQDALETLVAERLYYIERAEQLDEDPEDITEGPKGELYQKLRDQFGKGHKLVKGLEVKLRLCVDDSSDNPESRDAEVDELAAKFNTAFKLSAAERVVIRPEPILHYEQSIVATEKFFEAIKKSCNELVAKGAVEKNERQSKLPDEIKALLARLRSCEENGQLDKAMYLANKLLRIHPDVHTEECISLMSIARKMFNSERLDDALWCMKKLDDNRIKEQGKHDMGRNMLLIMIHLLEARMGRQNTFKRDQERIKVARTRVETCLKTYGLEHTTTLKAKHLLAEALLTAFENDEGFSILMDIYPLQARRLGHKHPEPMSTLEALLSNDLTEELTSFHVFKKAKEFFDKLCPVLSKKFPKTDRIVLKTRWFQAHVKCIVTGKMLGLDEQHPELNAMEQTLFEFVQKYPNDRDLFWMLWQVAIFFQKPHIGRNATFRIIMENFLNYLDYLHKQLHTNDRLHIQIKCSLLPDLQVQGENEEAINGLKQLYKQACKVLQPHDPTIWQILNTILLVFARIRSRSGPLKDDFDFFQEAYERLERLLGPLHPLTVNAYSIIPYIYGKWNLKLAGLKPNMDKIATLGHDALDRSIKVFGKDHDTTIRVRRGLGGIIQQMGTGSQTEAVCQLKQAVSSMKALKGDRHYNYDSFCKDVCRGYIEMMKIREAIDLVTQLYETSKRYYGPTHLSTLIAQKFVSDYKKMMTTPMVFEGEAPGGGMLFSIQL